MKRREFIKLSALSASLLLVNTSLFAQTNSSKTLILVELDGGNDGLNTVVPFKEKNYYTLRPTLGLKQNELYPLNASLGLNKNLTSLNELFREKNCAIINGLGYENPNKSHFRSIEIVETGSDSKEVLDEGWVAPILKEHDLTSLQPAHALLIGKRKQGHLFSRYLNVLQIKNIDDFIKKSSSSQMSVSNTSIPALSHIFKKTSSIQQSSEAFKKYGQAIELKTSFKESPISNDFKEAAKIIKSSLNIPVIKLSQKGYDTHANQPERHTKLLQELDQAIGSFCQEMKHLGKFNDILIVTYSEFGRRVKENGSLGTDHGTASCQFVVGGRVKGGIYGKMPSLKTLHKNNLIFTTHYRSLYNTVLNRWFGYKKNKFNSYDIINFL